MLLGTSFGEQYIFNTLVKTEINIKTNYLVSFAAL